MLPGSDSTFPAHNAEKRLGTSKMGDSSILIMRYVLALSVMLPLWAQTPEQLEAHNVSIAKTTYQGKTAVRLEAHPMLRTEPVTPS
jgi:hypothetical protein